MINWQKLESNQGSVYRAKVPGGWLILILWGEMSITFYPDPDHKWDGSSLP